LLSRWIDCKYLGMGLVRWFIEALAREHNHRPLSGDVLLIGRQTIYLTPEQLLGLYRDYGIDVGGMKPADVELDRSTIDRRQAFGDLPLVSDRAMLRPLGIERVRALDVSDYEGAEIVHDLNRPVPDRLKGIADIIIDGSTLDNTFNAAQTLMNYGAMLRPGGRLFAVNAASLHNTAYAVLPPMTWLDYFVYNGFTTCQLYIFVNERAEPDAPRNVFCIDLDSVYERGRAMARFAASYLMGCFAFAEKGAQSTSDAVPVQQDYRSSQDWELYRRNLDIMRRSKRPFLFGSTAPPFLQSWPGGHIYIDGNFQAFR
jgi:hypothetical protein